jgi:hypothetical protein
MGPSKQFEEICLLGPFVFYVYITPWAHVGFTVLFGLFAHGLLRRHRLYLAPLCVPVSSRHAPFCHFLPDMRTLTP